MHGAQLNPLAGVGAVTPEHDQTAKEFAALQARLALRGWTLTLASATDRKTIFYAARWGKARELADLAAVEAFANQVGA